MKQFPRNGCMNKTRTIASSVDMLTEKELNVVGSDPQTKNFR